MFKAGMTALVLGFAIAAHAQIDQTRLIATVNGEEIKGQEYYHRMEFLQGVGKRMGTSLVEFPPGFLTLEQLITEKLVLQLAKEKGVLPTDPEVQATLREKLTDSPKLLDDWLASGKTQDDLSYQIKVDLAQFKIETAGVTITDQELDAYYKTNPALFTIQKRYKLRTVVVTSDDAKALVDSDLAAGKKFSDIATARSEDLSRVNAGEFGTLPLNAIPEGPTRTAIMGIKIGQTTAWIAEGGKAWAKFLLEDVVPERIEELTPALRRTVRRRLMLQRAQVQGTNNVAKDMAEIRARSKIGIEQKQFADAYAKFIEAYLKSQGNAVK